MSRCGDGIVVSEDCDDGNNVDGDGCSAACKIEPGFMCKQPELGDKMVVPAVYRDFRAKTPDRLRAERDGADDGAHRDGASRTLDTDGKPVYVGNVANSYVTSATTFAQWYRDTPGVNHTTAGKLTLWSNGKGAYVNRYGAERRAVDRHRAGLLLRQRRREMLDAARAPRFPAHRATLPRPTATEMDALGLHAG